jgi:hypothetical protein
MACPSKHVARNHGERGSGCGCAAEKIAAGYSLACGTVSSSATCHVRVPQKADVVLLRLVMFVFLKKLTLDLCS